MLKQGKRVFEQGDQVDAGELILLSARVSQEVGDDVVEALGLARDDLQQLAVFGGEIDDAARQHADRAGDGGERVADFVGDGRGQASYGSQAVLHAHFALKAADFGKVIESIDVPENSALRHDESRDNYPEGFAKAVRGHRAHFAVHALGTDVGQRVHEKRVHRSADKVFLRALEHGLGRGIDQGDVAVEAGGDKAAADGMNDVFVQGLKIFERTAGVLELDVNLAKLVGQKPGQVGDRHVREQVDKNDGLQRFE